LSSTTGLPKSQSKSSTGARWRLAATLQEHEPYPSGQKQEKWVDERKTNHRIGNVVGLIHTLVAIGNGNCRKRDAGLPGKYCWGDAAKSHCIMKANVTGRHGEALLSKFVICVSNNNRPESLIVGRVYRALPDEDAAKHNLIRVIDETYGEPGSEDGYLYPTSMFVPIELPKVAEQMLMSAGAWAQ
jgi:hypothetical protein